MPLDSLASVVDHWGLTGRRDGLSEGIAIDLLLVVLERHVECREGVRWGGFGEGFSPTTSAFIDRFSVVHSPRRRDNDVYGPTVTDSQLDRPRLDDWPYLAASPFIPQRPRG